MDIRESLRQAEGNLKHEGMYLTKEERVLIIEAEGKITQKEFEKKVIELHTKNYENVEKAMKEIKYQIKSEKLIGAGYERTEEYK